MRNLFWASRLTAGVLAFLSFPLSGLATTNTVLIGDYFYNPTNSTIITGDTILWTNTVNTSHDSKSRSIVWTSPTLPLGGTYAFTFTNAGLYPYFCFFHRVSHPEQTGTVSVVTAPTNPPSAVTILNPTFSGSAFSFSFATQVGYNYSGQVTPSLNPVSWSTFTNLIGNGSVVQVTDSNLTDSTRYYRVGAQ